jgi:hypothetical protein
LLAGLVVEPLVAGVEVRADTAQQQDWLYLQAPQLQSQLALVERQEFLVQHLLQPTVATLFFPPSPQQAADVALPVRAMLLRQLAAPVAAAALTTQQAQAARLGRATQAAITAMAAAAVVALLLLAVMAFLLVAALEAMALPLVFPALL